MTIEIPTNCPSCDYKLVRIKDQLFCHNDECQAKNSKIVEKYANKLKIKGLGPAAVVKLGLSTINDIYDLSEEELEQTLGKNGLKVYIEIQDKTTLVLSDFLGACSIPLFGKTTAEKITTTLENITKESLMKDGIGDKASTNLILWLQDTVFPPQINFIEPVKLTGLKVCISGKIPGYTKAKLGAYLADYNISVVSTVNKGIKYLISEEKTSAKAQKAIKLNIEIISIEELKRKILNDK